MPKVLYGGYLGCGNLGDDAVLAGMVHGLGVDYAPTVLSGDPEATFREHRLPAVPRRDRRAVAEAIAACEVLVYPGGSVFQDSSSVRSVLYYAEQVTAARKAGKRIALVGQGVGPVKSLLGKRAVKAAFMSADVVTVRDPDSLDLLKSLGVTKASLAADSAFLLPPPPSGDETEAFGVGTMRTVALAPRPVTGVDVAALFADVCKGLFASGVMPVLVAMDREMDGPLIQAIADKAGGKIPDMKKLGSPSAFQARVARMDGVLAMRLHAGILAATVGVPPLMISYDPKVAAFARRLDVGNALPMTGLTAPRIVENLLTFLKGHESHVRVVARRTEELRSSAEGSVRAVRALLPA